MKLACVSALALLFGVAIGQSYPRNFGKTDAQILAMSSDSWMAFYAGKAGESNAAMIEGIECYRQALGRRNDAEIKKRSPADQAKLNSLRSKMTTYATDISAVAYYVNGGGSMFSVFGANWVMESESAMWHVLGHGGKAPPMVVSMARLELDRLPDRMSTAAKSMDAYDPEAAKRAYQSARLGFEGIVKIAAQMPRPVSDHILRFLRDCTKLASRDL